MEKEDLYKSGRKLGLNLDDIDNVLKYDIVTSGSGPGSGPCPPGYPCGSLYGTVSIDDF
jgi:hypothetical protein